MRFFRLVIITLWLTPLSCLFAQKVAEGSVTGIVVDKASGQPVELVAVILKKKADGKVAQSTATDNRGAFALEKIPPGEYLIEYNYIGLESQETPAFTVDAKHLNRDLGQLALAATSIKLEKYQVSARKEEFYNSLDRKVYNVGKDIQSSTGSASAFLQNIPSVQVDIEGNVSLRGNDNVLILIDGKPSTLMGTNRAAVLEQMPADSIERIEVITNPSAKYKPDGTAGIINITRKKKAGAGVTSAVRVSVGNDSRYNASLTSSFSLGNYSLYGSYSIRQDDRLRKNRDSSRRFDPSTGAVTLTTDQQTNEHARPLSHIAQLGGEYKINDANTVGAGYNYNLRTFRRTSTEFTTVRNDIGVMTDYDRNRVDPEYEKDAEYRANYKHSFAKPDSELSLDFKYSEHSEQEDNHYVNNYRVPASPAMTADNFLNRNTQRNKEATAEHVYPFTNDGKLESGYSIEAEKLDANFLGTYQDADGWHINLNTSNRFVFEQTIQALYGTYAQPLGDFGFMVGVRAEQTHLDTNQMTQVAVGSTSSSKRYYRLYPTLHLTHNLTDTQQLQLNYSHRVRRPESDDLNPFPEYQDPLHLRAGNPNLKPEETHSIESGWQYKKTDTTYLATVYYRQTYHAFTQVTKPLVSDPSVLITTQENLSNNRAGGLELSATRSFGGLVSINASSNIYRSQIDASNLGFSEQESALAWSAKLSSNVHLTKRDLLQLNVNYTAKRLTPQGYRLPSFVTNVGLRHDFADKKSAVLLTVSDLFDSLKERTHLDTPTLKEDITRRRSPRIIYLGYIYNFGKTAKKGKDDSMQFDNSAP